MSKNVFQGELMDAAVMQQKQISSAILCLFPFY